MKRNSKIVVLALALMMVFAFSLTACDNNGGTNSGSTSVATERAVTNKTELVNEVKTTYGGTSYLTQKSAAWTRLKTYYNGLSAPTASGIDWNSLVYNNDKLPVAAGTELRMAAGYNSAQTGITFKNNADATILPDNGKVTLADGVTYSVDDLKPTWKQLETVLGVTFKDKYSGKNSTGEYAYQKEYLDTIDIVSGTASTLNTEGVSGNVINLYPYLDKMPYFKAYLDENPIVKLSIMGSTTTGQEAIYFSPYFDGVDDIERMPLMRIDYVKTLLNGTGDFTATASANLKATSYTPYMPTEGTVTVPVVKADGSATENVVKDYSKYGNIIKKMNDAVADGTVTGVQAVNMLRKYIDDTYNNYYGTNRADLFIGQNAAYDADELVALLRCVTSNAKTLNGTDSIQGIFSREEGNNQRRVDVTRLAGILFGARGFESRNDYLYFDKDGNLVDARQQEDSYAAIEKMNEMYKEGLISVDYNKEGAETKSGEYLKKDSGFMSYDYNQTQTVLNETSLNLDESQKADKPEKYCAVMIPVAKWFDGTSTSGVYMRFTESWRSVKTDAWALSVDGIGTDTNKLNAALKLIDYAYSPQGQILMSYGPDSFISVKNASATTISEKYNTFDFNGKQMPEISAATKAELWSKASGNYTNYARQFLGSTLSFLKSQAFEYQCTHDVGKEGAKIISTAIALGTIKHPLLTVNTANMWYSSMPTVLPNTATENTILDSLTNLLATGKFSQTKGYTNVYVNMINGGYAGSGVTAKAA